MHAQTAASNFLVDPSQLRYEPDEKKLGEGAFAKVRKATFNNKVVAVKTLKFAMSSTSSKFEARAGKLFLEEADKMSQISHEHIVAFLGFINTTDTKSIILEYVPGGSLHTLLHCGAQSVRWLDKFWVARDIADGKVYVASVEEASLLVFFSFLSYYCIYFHQKE